MNVLMYIYIYFSLILYYPDFTDEQTKVWKS